jgi:hypothetical protein
LRWLRLIENKAPEPQIKAGKRKQKENETNKAH